MSHPIRALCLNVLQHKIPLITSPSHLLPRTQGSRSSQYPNANSKPGVSYHIPNYQRETKQHIVAKYNLLSISHIILSLCHSKFTFHPSITLFNHQSHCTRITHSDQDIITPQFHNKQLASAWDSYAKTQAYMQCGTMSVKNHPGALRST